VARNLFKLMAYKDEYEVARLQLDAAERAKLEAEFGSKVRVWFHLHPPLLRGLGLKRKLKLGRWFVPFLRLLRAIRFLRGTPFDPFGHTKVRRTERALIGEYEEMAREVFAHLSPATHELALEICELPDMIRGYEEIKLRSVDRFRQDATDLRERLAESGTPAAA
jgi:indolepyruvate ferredoxin oxidoreductase